MRTFVDLRHPLLLLIASSGAFAEAKSQWPYNLPEHVKYFPEDEAPIRRELAIEQRLATETPTGMKKMSGDPGEKFWLEYWAFDDRLVDARSAQDENEKSPDLRSRAVLHELPVYWNDSALASVLPPLRPLVDQTAILQGNHRISPRNIFAKRSFQCPAGTDSCADIGRPNSCCATDETCVRIRDTGLGDVGCCPSGSSCGGGISTCNEDEGYTSCPSSPNGGCCIPGFVCKDVGCVGAHTVTASVPTATTTIPPTTPETTSTPTTTTTTSSTCRPGFHSCGPQQGGGCCRHGFACRNDSCEPRTPSTTTSATAVPPVRPTSNSITTSSTISTPSACPTGFYMCSAYYRGGCCQVDRDCDSTSCPSPPMKTVENSNGATILVPATTTADDAGPTCGVGWFSCGAHAGGGCCPTGFKCGEQCHADGQTVDKEAPSGASTIHTTLLGWLFIVGAVVAGAGTALL